MYAREGVLLHSLSVLQMCEFGTVSLTHVLPTRSGAMAKDWRGVRLSLEAPNSYSLLVISHRNGISKSGFCSVSRIVTSRAALFHDVGQ